MQGILQQRVLDELWTQHGFSEREREVFQYLMEKFGLMCEVTSSTDPAAHPPNATAASKADVKFIVPAMLQEWRTATRSLPSGGGPTYTARIRFSDGHGNRVLPMHVFHHVAAKLIRWSQLSNRFLPADSSRQHVIVYMGTHAVSG